LCPMCNWRRAMKHGIQSQKGVAEVIKQKPTVRWLFLTLTVKNVYDGEELNKSLSDIAQGFRIMMQYKKINKNLIVIMLATEVKINNKDNSYISTCMYWYVWNQLILRIQKTTCIKNNGFNFGKRQ